MATEISGFDRNIFFSARVEYHEGEALSTQTWAEFAYGVTHKADWIAMSVINEQGGLEHRRLELTGDLAPPPPTSMRVRLGLKAAPQLSFDQKESQFFNSIEGGKSLESLSYFVTKRGKMYLSENFYYIASSRVLLLKEYDPGVSDTEQFKDEFSAEGVTSESESYRKDQILEDQHNHKPAIEAFKRLWNHEHVTDMNGHVLVESFLLVDATEG